MTADSQHWIVTLGARRGRLIKAATEPAGRWRTEQIDEIRNRWEGYHERGRPVGLSKGNGRRGTSEGYSFAAGSHDGEEMRRRFARDVSRWLIRHIKRQSMESVDVFAPPSILGTLRDEMPRNLNGRIRVHQGQLNPIGVGKLPEHSAISSLLPRRRRAD